VYFGKRRDRKSTELKVYTEFRYRNCHPLTLNRCELARPDRIVHLDLAHHEAGSADWAVAIQR
jgi:hypothetical protein